MAIQNLNDLVYEDALDTVVTGDPANGSVEVTNFPASWTVTDGEGSLTVDGDVSVLNFPSIFPVSDNGGSLTVDGLVAVTDNGGSLTVDGSVNIGNFPSVQPVSDNGGSLTVDGTVAVSNFPATQPVSGTVTIQDGGNSITVDGTVGVNNFPATQAVTQSGAWAVTVSDGSGPLSVDGTVSVGNFPATQNVADGGGSLTVDGNVGINNFPATQAVSAASLPLPTGAATSALQTTISGQLPSALGSYAADDVTAPTSLLRTLSHLCVIDQAGNVDRLRTARGQVDQNAGEALATVAPVFKNSRYLSGTFNTASASQQTIIAAPGASNSIKIYGLRVYSWAAKNFVLQSIGAGGDDLEKIRFGGDGASLILDILPTGEPHFVLPLNTGFGYTASDTSEVSGIIYYRTGPN